MGIRPVAELSERPEKGIVRVADMTEAEWLQSPDLHRMMQYMDGRASDRKLRLFACACCRRIWDLIEGDLQRRAVEVAERFADGAGRAIEWEKGLGDGRFLSFRKMIREPDAGEASMEWDALLRELEEERKSLSEDACSCRYEQASPFIAEWTLELGCHLPGAVADFAARVRAAPFPYWKQPFDEPVFDDDNDGTLFEQAHRAELRAQAVILRDILGNPFRPVAVEQAWLTPAVVTLARAIYDDRAFDRMPGLGDALEETGCDRSDILAHCRSEEEHVRGCWVVDAILGNSCVGRFPGSGSSNPG